MRGTWTELPVLLLLVQLLCGCPAWGRTTAFNGSLEDRVNSQLPDLDRRLAHLRNPSRAPGSDVTQLVEMADWRRQIELLRRGCQSKYECFQLAILFMSLRGGVRALEARLGRARTPIVRRTRISSSRLFTSAPVSTLGARTARSTGFAR